MTCCVSKLEGSCIASDKGCGACTSPGSQEEVAVSQAIVPGTKQGLALCGRQLSALLCTQGPQCSCLLLWLLTFLASLQQARLAAGLAVTSIPGLRLSPASPTCDFLASGGRHLVL